MPDHICNPKFKLKIVSQKWIEERFEEKIINEPTITHAALKKDIEDELNINVHISMVRRAQLAVIKKLQAGFGDQFKRLRDYAQECLNSNPGSTIIVKTERTVPDLPSYFQRIYVCFGAMKKGFFEGCRRIIGLDGCFLKGTLKGEILSAVARDANIQMYPVAWAVVEIENTNSWRWFLDLLKQDLDINYSGDWTFITDQQKGLTNVIQDLFPNAEHRNCARHVHANWSKKHKGLVFKRFFWNCAKATTVNQHNLMVEELGKKDSTAQADLAKYPARYWCKAFFRTNSKSDVVDNNMSEEFNGTLVKARSKPIIPMLEDIRVAMMKRVAVKRKSVAKWRKNYGPFIMKKLNETIKDSARWRVVFNGDDGYEIKRGRQQFKVKLQARSCSCRSWDLTGIPCPHAVCAILDSGRQPDEYIDQCYSKEIYEMTYAHTLQPINGELSWPRTNWEEMVAPVPRRMTGRPKKKRNREDNEPRDRGKLSRVGRIMTCSICRETGHNKKGCPMKTSIPQDSVVLSSSIISSQQVEMPSSTLVCFRKKQRAVGGK